MSTKARVLAENLFSKTQSGNGAKMPFGLRQPQTRAERFVMTVTQWVLAAIVVCLAMGLVALSVRFARWAITGSW